MKFLALVGPANVGKSTVLASLMRRAGGPRHAVTFRAGASSIPGSYVPSVGLLALGRFDGRLDDGAERLRLNQILDLPALLEYLALERRDVDLVVVDSLGAASHGALERAVALGLGLHVVGLYAPFAVAALRRPYRHGVVAARALHRAQASLTEDVVAEAQGLAGAAAGILLRNETLADLTAAVDHVSRETGVTAKLASRHPAATSPVGVIGNSPGFGPGDSRFDPSTGGSHA